MFSALLVVVLGLGIGALGLLLPDMYVVGLIVIFIGGIGVLVRLGDWYRTSRGPLV
jgi:hypothetical protein